MLMMSYRTLNARWSSATALGGWSPRCRGSPFDRHEFGAVGLPLVNRLQVSSRGWARPRERESSIGVALSLHLEAQGCRRASTDLVSCILADAGFVLSR